jgi:hypothetical protein
MHRWSVRLCLVAPKGGFGQGSGGPTPFPCPNAKREGRNPLCVRSDERAGGTFPLQSVVGALQTLPALTCQPAVKLLTLRCEMRSSPSRAPTDATEGETEALPRPVADHRVGLYVMSCGESGNDTPTRAAGAGGAGDDTRTSQPARRTKGADT